MGFRTNGGISFEFKNANVRYWEAKREVHGGVARSWGKEGLFWECHRFRGSGEMACIMPTYNRDAHVPALWGKAPVHTLVT